MARTIQSIFMLLITLAVGYLFITTTNPQDDRVRELEQELAAYQTALAQVQNPTTPTSNTFRPTLIPTVDGGAAAAPASDAAPPNEGAGAEASNDAGTQPTVESAPQANAVEPPLATFDSGGSNIPTSAPVQQQPTSPPVVSNEGVTSVQVSLAVNDDGCGVNPTTVFGNFEQIYGIGVFRNMQVGDVISVQFVYEEQQQTIFQENFTVEVGGNFCRWYDIVPDADGWDVGSYSVTYQVNNNPPMTREFTIGVLNSRPSATSPFNQDDMSDGN